MGRLAGSLEGLEARGGGEAEGRWIVAGGRGGNLSPRADSMAEVESSRSWQSAELAYKLPSPAVSPGSPAPGRGSKLLPPQ